MNMEKRVIELHLPTSWNDMTTDELEKVAAVLLRQTLKSGYTGTINLNEVKVELFFELNNLKLLGNGNKDEETGEEYYMVCRKGVGKSKDQGKKFPLFKWQISYWARKNMKWMDGPSMLTRFPYPSIRIKGKELSGPSVLMQNVCWRQYRLLGDYMSRYLIKQNQWVVLSVKNNIKGMNEMAKEVAQAKGLFLATLFCDKVSFIDRETGLKRTDFNFVSSQIGKNEGAFREFPEYKFQCILFWWSGMTNYLKRKYPKCFKSGNPKEQEKVNPLELYTRTTATMEKYLGMKEDEVNNELFTIVLQHLNDMVVENDRVKQLNL